MILAEQFVVAQNVHLCGRDDKATQLDSPSQLNASARVTHLLVLVHAVQHLLGDELLQVRDRGLRTAANEAPLQRRNVAHALQTDVHLLVATMVVRLDVRLVQPIEGIVIGGGGQILRTGQVAALVEFALAFRLIWRDGRRE